MTLSDGQKKLGWRRFLLWPARYLYLWTVLTAACVLLFYPDQPAWMKAFADRHYMGPSSGEFDWVWNAVCGLLPAVLLLFGLIQLAATIWYRSELSERFPIQCTCVILWTAGVLAVDFIIDAVGREAMARGKILF